MSDELRDRYRTLLRCYPSAYRAERGDEILDTYLDLARPGQDRPRAADVIDLVRGGARQHLRARHALGLADSVPFAAQLALMTGATLAALWLGTAELITIPDGVIWHPLGPFVTFGAAAWIAWLLAPLAALFGLGRPAVALALLTTVAVVPIAALTEYARPPLFVLVPHVALGLVALRVPTRRWSRLTAAGLALAGVTAWLAVAYGPATHYYALLRVTQNAGVILALIVAVSGVVFSVRRDSRRWWPALILLCPVLLLVMTVSASGNPQPWPTWGVAVVSAGVAVVTAAAALPATLWLRSQLWRDPHGGCPTCRR
ncbi:hypothetical protein ACFO1B_19485 [Dactylosporangium siamense]|uniref:Uncharacterized protein n=1 Tax=Dactylosporangium siamense TaxID=685454 RepID=A0A919U715_9ACTN|nr:hypothetical protein [Dactylosporangium siamense]GIG44067.1 hypothetical protein Dsi01nite_021080 [Dactylosporangium siamense]